MTRGGIGRRLRCARLCLGGLAALALCSLHPNRLHAFHNPARFFEDAVTGGGGGRFFTGSPADGFTCAACHVSAGPIPVSILGLPTSGYVPGQTYRITITWPEDYENVAFNAELTDDAGRTLGTLAVPAEASLSPADLCKEISTPAAQVGPTMDGRSLVISGACEQQQGTFEWTAPETGASAAWFSGSLLASDLNGDSAGDRVAVFSQIVTPQDRASIDAVHIEGLTGLCAISPGRSDHAANRSASTLLPVALLLWRLRRRLNYSRSRRR